MPGGLIHESGAPADVSGLALESGGNLDDQTAVLGATTGAAVITDAAGTIQQYLRGLVSSLIAVQGVTTGAAVITDAAGTLQQYLRGLVTLFAARIPTLGQADDAASMPVVQADAEVTTVYNAVVIDQDRTSTVVDKSGRNLVAIDITLAEGGGGPFNADGEILVLAGNGAGLVEADALSVPKWTVVVAGVVKLELETAFTHIALFYNFTADGDDDTITASIAVS